MEAEEEVGPICIITSYGIICMESAPALLVKQRGKKATKKKLLRKRLAPAERATLVRNVQRALIPAGAKVGLASPDQRRHIACVAVFLAEAAKLVDEHKRGQLDFQKYWAIVKRP